MNIYYLGPETYSELVAKRFKMQLVPLSNIDKVVEAISKDGRGIIPYKYADNTIHENIELMRAHGLKKIKEIRIEVKFAIGRYPKSKNYNNVYSHPIAIERCKEYLQRHYRETTSNDVENTAEGIQKVKERGEGLAIGRKDILLKHGLEIIGENVGNRNGIQTFTDFYLVKHYSS